MGNLHEDLRASLCGDPDLRNFCVPVGWFQCGEFSTRVWMLRNDVFMPPHRHPMRAKSLSPENYDVIGAILKDQILTNAPDRYAMRSI
jgi:hypothetical protein